METPSNQNQSIEIPIRIIGFTLSPKPQRCLSNISLFIAWSFKIHAILKKFSKDYKVYHEFDDSGRLHFHGTIEPYDMIKFKKMSGVLRSLGFVKYEMKLKSYEAWIAYISKSREETLKIYGNVPEAWLPLDPEVIKKIGYYLKEEEERQYKGYRNKITNYLKK